MLQFLPANYVERIATLSELIPSRTNQLSDRSFRGRLSENLAAWYMFLDNPVLGVGLGNYKVNYLDYSRRIGMDPRSVERAPASLYLELLSEQGVIGTGFFIVLMVVTFRGLRDAENQFKDSGLEDEANMSTAIFASLVGYLFAAINKNSAYANVFWSLIGVAMATSQVAHTAFLKTKEDIRFKIGHLQ
jgi:O-antigen ligase